MLRRLEHDHRDEGDRARQALAEARHYGDYGTPEWGWICEYAGKPSVSDVRAFDYDVAATTAGYPLHKVSPACRSVRSDIVQSTAHPKVVAGVIIIASLTPFQVIVWLANYCDRFDPIL